jgi:hypothetical protein
VKAWDRWRRKRLRRNIEKTETPAPVPAERVGVLRDHETVEATPAKPASTDFADGLAVNVAPPFWAKPEYGLWHHSVHGVLTRCGRRVTHTWTIALQPEAAGPVCVTCLRAQKEPGVS